MFLIYNTIPIVITILILIFFQIVLLITFFITYKEKWLVSSSSIEKHFKKERFYSLDEVEKEPWYSITESYYNENQKNNEYNVQKISYLNEPGHCLIVGGSGSGKTQKIIIPTILLNANSSNEPSFIINDIKGEIFEKTSKYLKDRGYKVINLNLNTNTFVNENETINSDFFNPLLMISRKRNNPLELKDLIDSVAKFIFNEDKERDPFWLKKSQELFIGIIFLMIEDKVSEEDFTFQKVAEVFSNLSFYKTKVFNPSARKEVLFFLKDFFEDDSKTISSVFLTFKVEISKYIAGIIEVISSKSSFEIDDLLDRKTVIFLNNKGNNAFIQNYISMVIFQINSTLFNKPELTLKRPIINILDEFANFSKLEKFENWLSLTRQKNIWYVIAVQSMSQFENVYGDINIYSSNFRYDYFLGGGDQESYSYFVKGYREESKEHNENNEKLFDKISYTRFNTLSGREYILRVKGFRPTIQRIDYVNKISNLFYKEVPQPIQNIYNISEENLEEINKLILRQAFNEVFPEKIKNTKFEGTEDEIIEQALWSLNNEELELLKNEIKQSKYQKV